MSRTRIPYDALLAKTVSDWIGESGGADVTQHILRTTLEALMEAEREAFLASPEGRGDKGNGYYSRLARTMSGTFEISVPRDRAGAFRPLMLSCMKRDAERLNGLAFQMYVRGMTTRDIGAVLEETFGGSASPQYVSNVTKSMEGARRRWERRNLPSRYYAIYVDATHLPIRRDTVENEAVYVALGLTTDLKREILGIYSIPRESASGWRDVLEDLRGRGVSDVLIFVADGLTGLESCVRETFPRSRFQKCVVHLKRNVLRKVRNRDRDEVAGDLKRVFDMDAADDTPGAALGRMERFREKWKSKYPGVGRSCDPSLMPFYFTYLDFPHAVRRMVYSTNWIERLNKHLKKALKNRNSMPNEDSVLNLMWASAMLFEEETYRYPVTAFRPSADELDDMFIAGGETQEI